MYHTEDENLLRLAKKLKENPQSFICILGAGMSIPAGLPSWNGLLEGMIDYYEAFCKDKKEDCRDWGSAGGKSFSRHAFTSQGSLPST